MKRTVSVLIIIAMLLASILAIVTISATEAEPEVTPEGTPINNIADFAEQLLLGDTTGKKFYLNTDLAVGGLSGFKGTLDGNGHTLTVGAAAFDELNGATVKNLNLVVGDNANVFGAISNGAVIENVTITMKKGGSIASSVEDSTIKGITATVENGGSSILGSAITNSTVSEVVVNVAGTKTISKSENFGGLTTIVKNSTLKDVAVHYPIKVAGFKAYIGYIGGIAAEAGDGAVFENVKYSGEIKLNTWAIRENEVVEKVHLGGIAGRTSEKGTVVFRGCENAANIQSTQTTANVGGILGFVYNSTTTVADCVNLGELMTMSDNGSNHVGLGGMVGWVNNRGTMDYKLWISGCENRGNIRTTPYETVFMTFCEISAAEQNKANKDKEGYVAVDAEQYAKDYIASFAEQYRAIEGNENKSDADVAYACKTQSQFKSGNCMYLGGMIGRTFAFPHISINSCKNFANITGTGTGGKWGGTGGIVGAFCTVGNWEGVNGTDISIINCYNEGKISGQVPGGIVGGKFLQFTSTKSKLVIEYCINNGEINGRNGNWAGGIVGSFDGTSGENACMMTDITINHCANYGNVTGATFAGGIVSDIANGDIKGVRPVISNCYNAGNITTAAVKDGEDNITTEDRAGGIVGVAVVPSDIKNCINAGVITTEVAGKAYPVTADSSFITAENNIHLTVDGSYKHSAAKAQGEIDAAVAKLVFQKNNNNFDIKFVIAEAEALIDIDYTDATWSTLTKALEAAKAICENIEATQETMDNAEKALTDAIGGLVQKVADFTKLDKAIADGKTYKERDWNSRSFLALQNAIAAGEALKEEVDVLQSEANAATELIEASIRNLEKRGESITLATRDFDDITGSDLRPTQPTATQPQSDTATEGTAPAATEAPKQGGCGGIIGGAAVVLLAAAAIGVGVSFKKRED